VARSAATIGGIVAVPRTPGKPTPSLPKASKDRAGDASADPGFAAPRGMLAAMDATAIRYVALGDSYTIGTSVAASERWPDQLVRALAARAEAGEHTLTPVELVANLGVNGFTSRDVIDRELPRLAALRPGLVSLLIGVNDVVQGVTDEPYRRNVALILDALVALVGPQRVFVVTTPDYTVTPAGSDYGDPARQAAAIRRANASLTELATARGIAVVDIRDISLRVATDRSLVAIDGLHPSGALYALWVDRIAPVVAALLDR
jgi:acyl-CoA thioesterase I